MVDMEKSTDISVPVITKTKSPVQSSAKCAGPSQEPTRDVHLPTLEEIWKMDQKQRQSYMTATGWKLPRKCAWSS